jgi:hypothetical protein
MILALFLRIHFGVCCFFSKFAIPENKISDGEVDEWLKSVVC